jgi:hypothetical protein
MIAILAESEMNRRHLSMISGHNGVIAFNMVYGTKNATHHPPSSVRLMRDGTALQVECLSEVLCSKNTVTDSRGIDGMRSCQAASASALAFLSRFGGMDRLVQVFVTLTSALCSHWLPHIEVSLPAQVLKTAETDVQILAASALAQIAGICRVFRTHSHATTALPKL